MAEANAAGNAFEERRLANIRRNNAIMEGMGIPALVPAELRRGASAAPRRKGSAGRKRAAATPPAETTADRRRSARLRNAPAVVHTTFEVDEDFGDTRRSRKAKAPADDGEAAAPPLHTDSAAAAPAAAGSSRAMRAQVADMQASWLGKQILPQDGSGAMKAAAMARLRGSSTPPRFNKYSGIQEFSDAVALFVNVRGKAGALYPNVFVGRTMSWFASSSQNEQTPVVARLLACTAAAGSAATPVVLFCREEGAGYIYCGRLRCAKYFPSSAPLKLVWELLDFDVIQQSPDFVALLSNS